MIKLLWVGRLWPLICIIISNYFVLIIVFFLCNIFLYSLINMLRKVLLLNIASGIISIPEGIMTVLCFESVASVKVASEMYFHYCSSEGQFWYSSIWLCTYTCKYPLIICRHKMHSFHFALLYLSAYLRYYQIWNNFC